MSAPWLVILGPGVRDFVGSTSTRTVQINNPIWLAGVTLLTRRICNGS